MATIKTDRETVAVRGLSFDVPAGSIVGFSPLRTYAFHRFGPSVDTPA